MQTQVLGLMVGAALFLTACNTVTRGTEETVTITTSPASARIWTSLGHKCPRSPCEVTISRKTEFTAYAEAKGYRPGSVLVKPILTEQAAPGILGNAILPGGSVGLVLDAANGAMLDHRPNPAHMTSRRLAGADADDLAGDKAPALRAIFGYNARWGGHHLGIMISEVSDHGDPQAFLAL
ncbi:translation initiation factor 2 [Microvirga zambiensis]|uniref:translation initiation factor 2 n=1 Tax=Microvirga zambiensis TaxID=1402137 RepID=UPI00191E1A20|nr:translation initiation factor 2 [Microvirga zambiensis]